jgi:hypothetical protein
MMKYYIHPPDILVRIRKEITYVSIIPDWNNRTAGSQLFMTKNCFIAFIIGEKVEKESWAHC